MPRVTCHLRYEIDPARLDAFERFARRWIALVERSGLPRTFLRPLLDGDADA
jgi:hypothetical protein